MKTEQITSNRGRYHYKLTPTELIGEMNPNGYGYILQVIEMMRLPRISACRGITTHYTFRSSSDDGLSVTCFYTNFKNKNFVPLPFCFRLDKKGRLHIGCREFNKTTTKKLLRWAGLLPFSSPKWP